MHVTAIIAAGGRGERLGAGRPKQLLDLAGRPILQRSVDAFLASPRIDEVVVVLPQDLASAPPAYLRSDRKPLIIGVGGARRQDSVAAGFDLVAGRSDILVVHDAARPLVDGDTIARTIDAAAESGAAVAALPSRDTVKEARFADGRAWAVARTIDRAGIYLAQTPQAFRRDVLGEAVAMGRRGVEVTDEAMLAERAGHTVRLVEGSPRNLKITTPEDLLMAEALLQDARGTELRVGTGYDLHRLVEGRPLILGGVTIPFERGLAGHSDADAVCHAVTDAVLGACGAGDIGRLFPDTDARWKGARSVELLREAGRRVREAGATVVNLDVVVIAERPKLVPHLATMCATVADALGIEVSRVGIKGKTNEGVDAAGRGEAIAVHATALVRVAVR